mmetsp:Transcript_57456/g.69133  ORF Transcript_57456/g.69133 Transcript_57456/m.69133 type:complete len:148 (-) Transcript_57456:331-774(-)|eukprot:CAMPEP_0194357432 /NCGR_PEP_ID=MMETSP0174-20130528/4910_1 /TAXON_ID=216777 /ORGANISM="Proboscia alata, Strain PI-D3" /LENGTH=147 /DNA_ID=CAMNT_0039127451 /DNA_START=83 /DNA_END=526 /DNA_ORIENTATION=-
MSNLNTSETIEKEAIDTNNTTSQINTDENEENKGSSPSVTVSDLFNRFRDLPEDDDDSDYGEADAVADDSEEDYEDENEEALDDEDNDEPATANDAATDILDQLVELFVEQNGRAPKEEEVRQWIETFKSVSNDAPVEADSKELSSE